MDPSHQLGPGGILRECSLYLGEFFFLFLLLLPPLQWIAVRLSVINWPPSKLPAFFSFFSPPLRQLLHRQLYDVL